jgi:hypothetical protein
MPEGGQFIGDVAVHLIVLGPRLLRRIEVKAGTLAHLPVGEFVRHIRPARARIRADDDEAELRGHAAILALFHHIRMRAGEARKIPEDRSGLADRLRRHVDGEGHFALADLGIVGENALHTAEGGIL